MMIASVNIDRGQSNQTAKIIKKIHEPSKYFEVSGKAKGTPDHVPNIYRKWRYLFQKEETAAALSKHQQRDYKIKLKSNKHFTIEFIYAFFEKKNKTLREYLNENLKKKIYKYIKIIDRIFNFF